jgi:hypothetical protein
VVLEHGRAVLTDELELNIGMFLREGGRITIIPRVVGAKRPSMRSNKRVSSLSSRARMRRLMVV